jgi:integrase
MNRHRITLRKDEPTPDYPSVRFFRSEECPHLDRKTPWRLVKKYCQAAGINPSRLGGRGVGIHSLRKTAINDAIRNGATMHEVREFAGHADIRTTEIYFVRKEEDAEVAARRIHIRLTGSRDK